MWTKRDIQMFFDSLFMLPSFDFPPTFFVTLGYSIFSFTLHVLPVKTYLKQIRYQPKTAAEED